jgi:hypothetical protein
MLATYCAAMYRKVQYIVRVSRQESICELVAFLGTDMDTEELRRIIEQKMQVSVSEDV